MNKSQRRTFKQVKDIIYVNDAQSNGYQNTGANMSIRYEYPELGMVITKKGDPSLNKHYEYQLWCNGQSVDLPRRKLRRLGKLAQQSAENVLIDNVKEQLASANSVWVNNFYDDEIDYTGVYKVDSAKECTPSTLMFAIDEFGWFIFDAKCYFLSPRVVSRLIKLAKHKVIGNFEKSLADICSDTQVFYDKNYSLKGTALFVKDTTKGTTFRIEKDAEGIVARYSLSCNGNPVVGSRSSLRHLYNQAVNFMMNKPESLDGNSR